MAPLKVGAVAYHPRVVTIWESFNDYFERAGVPTDYVLYSNYEALVEAVIAGDVEIGWNANTAFVQLDHAVGGATKILGMRDIDADFASVIVARKDRGIEEVLALDGERLAVGARDCGHATILPLHYLRQDESVTPDPVRFESGLGKHGDTGQAELEVIQSVASGDTVAGALGDITWEMFRSQGVSETGELKVIWRSPTFYHCNFTALESLYDDLAEHWSTALLAMSFDDPEMRNAMELEGVRRWLPGDRTGYESLTLAMGQQGYLT